MSDDPIRVTLITIQSIHNRDVLVSSADVDLTTFTLLIISFPLSLITYRNTSQRQDKYDLGKTLVQTLLGPQWYCQGHSNPKLPVPEEGIELNFNGWTYTTGCPTNTA